VDALLLAFTAIVTFARTMLPRGLRPLATEETCRTLTVVTWLLALAATVTSLSTGTVVPNVSFGWSSSRVTALLAAGRVKVSHSWHIWDVWTIECEEMTPNRH